MSLVSVPTPQAPGATARGAFKAAAAADLPWPDLVDQALAALAPIAPETNFGLLFVTDLLASELPGILARLHAQSPIQEWAGSVSLGICGNDAPFFDRPALSLMVAALPPGSFHLFDHAEVAPDWAAAMRPPIFALVHGDPRHHDPIGAVARLADQTRVPLAGGLARARTTPWQVAGHVVEGGLAGILFDDRVPVLRGMIQGSRPIGPDRRITKVQGNLIFEIDGIPALDAFKADIGVLLARDLRQASRQIFIGLPHQRTAGAAPYLNRPLLALDPTLGWLAVSGPVAAGDRMNFCRHDRAAAEQEMRSTLRDLVLAGDGRIDAGLYYACADQTPADYTGTLSLIRRILGDIPLVGFYGQGQIVDDRIYGQSGAVILFLGP